MGPSDETDSTAMLERAATVQARIRRGGRWYPAMMTAYGVVSVALVAWLPLVRSTWAGIAFAVVAVAWAAVMFAWKRGQDVRPAHSQDTRRWLVSWVVLYTTAVFWFGPTYLNRAVGWWALMGVVVAVPAFVEAARAWVRVRS